MPVSDPIVISREELPDAGNGLGKTQVLCCTGNHYPKSRSRDMLLPYLLISMPGIQFVDDQASARDLLPTRTSPALGFLQPRQIADGENGVVDALVSSDHLARGEQPSESSQESFLGDEEPLLGASNNPPSSDIAQSRAPTPGPLMTSHTIYLLKHYESHVSPWVSPSSSSPSI